MTSLDKNTIVKYEKLKNSFLNHICIYIKSEFQPKNLLGSFVDNWYAYAKEANNINYFVNKNGNPIWFNNPNPKKHKLALLNMDFISEDAMNVINGFSEKPLVKDHSVPINEIFNLFDRKNINRNQVEQTLLKYCRLGVITKVEDENLNSKGLRSKMPEKWDNVFARYEKIGLINSKIT